MFIPISVNGERLYACHGIFDGLSALDYLNKKKHLGLELSALKKEVKSVTFLQRATSLWQALRSHPKETHQFKPPVSSYLSPHHYFAFHLSFNPEEFRQDRTAYFFNKFSKFMMKRFSTNKVTRWQFSINVRGEVAEADQALMASYLSLDCDQEDTVADTKNKLKHKLKVKEYLGFWYLSKFLLNFGKKTLISLTKRDLEQRKSSWFGLFTNLGAIGGDGKNEVLLYPTVRWHRPLAGLIFEHKQKIFLTVLIHKRFQITDDDVRIIKDELRSDILSR